MKQVFCIYPVTTEGISNARKLTPIHNGGDFETFQSAAEFLANNERNDGRRYRIQSEFLDLVLPIFTEGERVENKDAETSENDNVSAIEKKDE